MAVDWNEVRYRGDAEDVAELESTYRINDYLEAFEENRRRLDRGLREELLKSGIRLTQRLSPRIFTLFQEVSKRLEIASETEVFCLPDQDVNAFALVEARSTGTFSVLGITSGALEKLSDSELRSILGHELGHFLFGNNRLNALIIQDPENPSATVLPPLGEALFLRWRKKAEISADRVGLLASRDYRAAATSLMKATFGLSDRNLNLDVEALLAQIDEIKGRPELMEEAFASHPLLPIRLKALELFSRSAKAQRAGIEVRAEAIADEDLEGAVDELLDLTRRYPHKPLHEAIMKTIALAGAMLLGADQDISDDEVKILIQVLHQFTDEPEAEIVTDPEVIRARLPELAAVINEQGDQDDKTFVLSRLADIALADGALMETEGAVVLEVGELLQLSQKIAYSILVGAAQSVGFSTDVKLNRIAEDLRKTLQVGLTAPLQPARPPKPPRGRP